MSLLRMQGRRELAMAELDNATRENAVMDVETTALRDNMAEHLGGVRQLLATMGRTVVYVKQVTDEREQAERTRKREHMAKLHEDEAEKRSARAQIRRPTGVALAMGSLLETRFRRISDVSGYGVEDVELIITRILNRGVVLSDLGEVQRERKQHLAQLCGSLQRLASELLELRSDEVATSSLRQLDSTLSRVDASEAALQRPKALWLTATHSLLGVLEVCVLLQRKVHTATSSGAAPLRPDVQLWEPRAAAKNGHELNSLLSQLESTLLPLLAV